MRQENAVNRRAQVLSRSDYRRSAAWQIRVDERKAIVFPNEEAVDEAKSSKASQSMGFLSQFHWNILEPSPEAQGQACQESSEPVKGYRPGYGELHRLRDIHLVYQLPGFVEALNSTVTAQVVAQKMRSLILRSLREPWGTQLLVVLGLASARENAR